MIILWSIVWVIIIVLFIIWFLLKFKGKYVIGQIIDINYVSGNTMSNIKVEVDGKIIKSKIDGNPEKETKVKLIKYKGIYVTEDYLQRILMFAVYMLFTMGIMFIIFLFSDDTGIGGKGSGKVVAVLLCLVMFWVASVINWISYKRTKELVKHIKSSDDYKKIEGTIIEKVKDGNEYVYLAQFTHNGEIYKKEIWTSALKNNFKIGEIIEMYFDEKNADSDVFVTFGKKDKGKEKLLLFLSLSLFVIGAVGAILVYINN